MEKEKNTKSYSVFEKGFIFSFLFALLISNSIFNALMVAKCHKHYVFSGCSSVNQMNNNSQWAISKIQLDKAWKITTGSSAIKVGIIDTGIDGDHEDLLDNINASLSHSFCANVSGLEDIVAGHGTHVSGIIGANGNNNFGIDGVCWDVDLISLRVANQGGSIDESVLDDAIGYAQNNDIPIINISINGATPLADLENAISNYSGLIVCSVGNESLNLDNNFFNYISYPACYIAKNIISVGASTINDTIWLDSNYGSLSVDLFAPGNDIYSTLPDDDYGSASGTSMAAPMVTGVAALLLSIDPTLTTSQIRSAIFNGVDQISDFNNLCFTGGRLNAYKAALNVIPSIPEQSTPETYVSDISYTRILKIDCDSAAHYVLNFSGPSNYRITLYTLNGLTPIYSGVINDNSTHQIAFASNTEQEVFVKVENLSNANGYFNANLSQITNHNYDSYRYYNQTYHKSVCACGLYILEEHIYPNFSQNCIMCSVLPPLNIEGTNANDDNITKFLYII